jgi:hypothetical protein
MKQNLQPGKANKIDAYYTSGRNPFGSEQRRANTSLIACALARDVAAAA